LVSVQWQHLLRRFYANLISVLNLIIGINGVKFWAREHKKAKDLQVQEIEAFDVKEKLLDN